MESKKSEIFLPSNGYFKQGIKVHFEHRIAKEITLTKTPSLKVFPNKYNNKKDMLTHTNKNNAYPETKEINLYVFLI